MKVLNKINALLHSDHKWEVFGLILLVIVVLGTLLSFVARYTFLHDDVATRPRIAVVGPMQSPVGIALRQGAELYAEVINRKGGYKGRQVEVVALEETAQAEQAVTSDKRFVAVVGYLDAGLLQQAAPLYALSKIPVVTPLHLTQSLGGVVSMGLDPQEQARFAANYARNIQQQRLMYVVREAGTQFDPLVEPFLEVYKRFDTPVREIWTVPSAGSGMETSLAAVMAEIGKIDIGAVYVATNPVLAARIVKGIRATGNALEVFGSAQMAMGAFGQEMKAISGADAPIQTHGIVAATPVLFDTANEEAQRFQTHFQQKFGASPDWLATYAYDAVKVALAAKPGVDDVKGINGVLRFSDGQSQLPIQMGIYNGESIISAPVQMLPIAKGASFNYIEALRQGRVLYVNNRFMFKTNVVYVGVTLNEVSDLDLQKEVATLDMSIWFRYRGSFSPQDLQIANAVEPVKFDTPEESKESDQVQYRRYRIKQKFQLNFTDAKRAYGQHVAGITFRHRALNRNNLMYVVDVLGMPTGNALIGDLHTRKVVKSSTGWEVDNAWVAQELARERGDGAPQYVGMTGEQPFFSTITLGVLLKPATATARDLIQDEFFVYIAIFGVLGTFFAVVLDTRKWTRQWALHSWLLRVMFWPLLLLSCGNMALDWAFANMAPNTTRTLVTVYESLWWIIGAWLFDKAVRRFIWETLEYRTKRKVPNVMKFFTSLLLFLLAIAGITAFVFNQALTSLLATSGVFAMVVGFAIQANIANVFSGIILNIERPFKVGDYIKINNIIGQVKDITWRTTRIESNDGQMVSLANSKVSESFMENYSEIPHGIAAETVIHTPHDVDAHRVVDIINDALAHSKAVLKGDQDYDPFARYKGIVNINGYWVAEFSAGYRVKNLPKKSQAKSDIWNFVTAKFAEQGLALVPVHKGAEKPDTPVVIQPHRA